MGKIYKFDVGTRLRTTLSADLTGYNTVEYKIEKPDNTVLTKPCTPENITNGIIYYDTILNDLDQAGYYHIQTQLLFLSGNKYESETKEFRVYDSFE